MVYDAFHAFDLWSGTCLPIKKSLSWIFTATISCLQTSPGLLLAHRTSLGTHIHMCFLVPSIVDTEAPSIHQQIILAP